MASNSINNTKTSQNNINEENFREIIFNSLNEIEQRTKEVAIKDVQIKENIRSIKLKEKKIDKLNEAIINKKEELKLMKELLFLKEEKNMDIKNIIDSYIDFLISSNDMLDNKFNELFQREININSKQKIINKLLGEEEDENDYDYIYEKINKPIDISKFYIKPNNRKNNYNDDNIAYQNGEKNYDRNYRNGVNNKSPLYEKFSYENKPKDIPYNFEKSENLRNKNNNNNKIDNSKEIEDNKNYNIFNSFDKFEETIPPKKNNKNQNNYNYDLIINNDECNDTYNVTYPKQKYYNDKNNTFKEESKVNDMDINNRNNFAKTDINDYQNYNLKANNKLKRAREIFKRLLNKLKKKNELLFSQNYKIKNLPNFIYNVLYTHYFLRKILSICFECALIYDPNNKIKNTETMHDSEFLGKLINSYEDSDENVYDDINNIKIYEKDLEEIKKITKETRQLKDKISQFANEINITD